MSDFAQVNEMARFFGFTVRTILHLLNYGHKIERPNGRHLIAMQSLAKAHESMATG
jgi:hypothetical protein